MQVEAPPHPVLSPEGRGKADGGDAHTDLVTAAVGILTAADPAEKVARSLETARAWRAGELAIGCALPPDRPARPDRPPLRAPREMKRRRVTRGLPGRIALLHAVAHIELNAIDLAWDLVARFAAPDLPRAFFEDWVAVAAEEAGHHALVCRRLAELGACYGDLPAHAGMWDAALTTRHDLLARLAVVPLVLEARGLDVTPPMIARLSAVGDDASAAVLQRIYDDEIGHVAVGLRWFDWLATARGLEPTSAWQAQVRRHFPGALKPPFNDAARGRAGFGTGFYLPLAEAAPHS
jgi:uncharacterized ferritin-like protein (DUF455 family)